MQSSCVPPPPPRPPASWSQQSSQQPAPPIAAPPQAYSSQSPIQQFIQNATYNQPKSTQQLAPLPQQKLSVSERLARAQQRQLELETQQRLTAQRAAPVPPPQHMTMSSVDYTTPVKTNMRFAHQRYDDADDNSYTSPRAQPAAASTLSSHDAAAAHPPTHLTIQVDSSDAPDSQTNNDDIQPEPPQYNLSRPPLFSPHVAASPSTPRRGSLAPSSADRRGSIHSRRNSITSPLSPMAQVDKAPAFGLATVHDLLAPPTLQVYLPFFNSCGHTDLDVLLEKDEEELEAIMDVIGEEADKQGVVMKGGHVLQIMSRLKEEKVKRDAWMKQHNINNVNNKANRRNRFGEEMVINNDIDDQKATPVAGANAIMYDGVRGLLKHWCCCFGLCIFLIVISVLLFQLRENLASSSSTGVNNSSVSSSSSGGWAFVYIISIIGFVLGGISFLMCVYTWVRFPESRACKFLPSCPDLKECCKCNCRELCAGCCSCFDGCCDGCCEHCTCGGICTDCASDCSKLWHSCLALLHCSACSCAECGCPELSCASCSCKECCAECGCDQCAQDCTQCCADCDCKPNCDCNCCPDCEGDLSSLCSTCYKVCCCQCKIQVS